MSTTPSRLLQTLDPPAGGWERLVHRRDESWALPATALTCAVMVVVFAFPWPHRERLQLPLSGARLIGERSHGTTVRLLDDRQVVALPSVDPNVKLYWIGARSE